METTLVVSSILLWIVALLNILLTLGLARRIRSAFPRLESLKAGQKAPGFSAQTLQGQTITLTDYEGRATAFIFGGTEVAVSATGAQALNKNINTKNKKMGIYFFIFQLSN